MLVKLTRPIPQYLSTHVRSVRIFYELVVFLPYTLLYQALEEPLEL